MGKWTRRAFLTTGALVGGGFIAGIAVRPGNRAGALGSLVEGEGETLVQTWVKIGADNTVTVIVATSDTTCTTRASTLTGASPPATSDPAVAPSWAHMKVTGTIPSAVPST